VSTSIIFARVGYIPKNLVQNLIMAMPHQGAYFLYNASRAAQVLADPYLRELLAAEVGTSSATAALGAERSIQKAGTASRISSRTSRTSRCVCRRGCMRPRPPA
jgi:hypothetical protein